MTQGVIRSLESVVQEILDKPAGGTVLVLEGETDVALFNGLLGEDAPELIDSGGRIQALRVAGHVPGNARMVSDVLVLVDSDFDRLTGHVVEYADALHVVFTDAHDMETTIISVEQVRRRVLTTILRCNYTQALAVWSRSLEYQVELGLFRLASHCEDWGINLEGIPPNTVLQEDGGVNRGSFAERVIPRLRAKGIQMGPGQLMSLMEDYAHHAANWTQLVNGHSLCKTIAWYGNDILGRAVSGSQIEDGLRMACQKEILGSMWMGTRVRAWCASRDRSAFI